MKQPGVSYAVTDDGLELPVIDVTHPAFAVAPTEAELSALAEAFLDQMTRMQTLPADVQQTIRRQMLETSIIGRGLLAAFGTFITGMNTYVMKLGPDNLGEHAAPLDRQIAASLPLLSLRMRLQDVATLLAESLAPLLEQRPERPLHLVNIAGGPAVDSLNALILLRRDRPELVAERAITVHVCDRDTSGPAFGARALDALRSPGAKLHGLDVTFRHVIYDWRHTSRLVEHLQALDLPRAVWAATSEGGLFEYGSDEEIVANLAALGSVDGKTMSGSVTRGDGLAVRIKSQGGVATVPRTLEAFTAIAGRAGWAVERTIVAPFSFNVRLTRV